MTARIIRSRFSFKKLFSVYILTISNAAKLLKQYMIVYHNISSVMWSIDYLLLHPQFRLFHIFDSNNRDYIYQDFHQRYCLFDLRRKNN